MSLGLCVYCFSSGLWVHHCHKLYNVFGFSSSFILKQALGSNYLIWHICLSIKWSLCSSAFFLSFDHAQLCYYPTTFSFTRLTTVRVTKHKSESFFILFLRSNGRKKGYWYPTVYMCTKTIELAFCSLGMNVSLRKTKSPESSLLESQDDYAPRALPSFLLLHVHAHENLTPQTLLFWGSLVRVRDHASQSSGMTRVRELGVHEPQAPFPWPCEVVQTTWPDNTVWRASTGLPCAWQPDQSGCVGKESGYFDVLLPQSVSWDCDVRKRNTRVLGVYYDEASRLFVTDCVMDWVAHGCLWSSNALSKENIGKLKANRQQGKSKNISNSGNGQFLCWLVSFRSTVSFYRMYPLERVLWLGH